ncbi:MAG: peptide ABC transporter substrate-binding protein [Oscillibacter sp.]|nr:peptide ABC transporter substrate-binding protein [Oscillibacter sp.]
MKKTLALTLALALVLALLAACGSQSDTQPEAPGEQQPAAQEQYLNALLTSEPSVLDVGRCWSLVDRTILQTITEPLIRIENGLVTAAGAESWTLSEDGLTLTFVLRDNLWSDGQPVTAQDYLTALQRQADPENAFANAADYFPIENFEAIFNGEMELDTLGVTAPDEKTLVITLGAPNPAFLSSMDLYPCRADLAEQYGDAYGTEAETVLSCGPFTLNSWVHNSSMEFTRNENYWDKANVALDRFTYWIITDESAQMNSLENGSLDYAAVSSEEYALKFSTNSDMYPLSLDNGRTALLVFNCQDEVFSNMKIRQAFSLALDRDTLVLIANGGIGTPAYGLIPHTCYVGDINYREATAEPLLAVQAANPDPKALLIAGMEELGLGSDPAALSVSFAYGGTSAADRTAAELYQQMWQDTLGVTVTIDFNESTTNSANIRAGNYQIGSVGWGSTYEPQFQISRWVGGGQSFYMNEEFDALVNSAMSNTNDAERLADYQKAEELLVNEAAIAPTFYNGNRTYAYNYVSGIPTNPNDSTTIKTISTAGR